MQLMLCLVQFVKVGCIKIAYSKVSVHYTSIGVVLFNLIWYSRIDWAWTTVATMISWCARVASNRVVRVKPEHVSFVVIPQAHSKDHTVLHLISHLLKSSDFIVMVFISINFLGGFAEIVIDFIVWFDFNSIPHDVSVIEDFSVLDPFTSDSDQVTICSSIISNPLSDNGDSRVCIDGFSWSIKFFISKTESSPIATILITDTIVSFVRSIVSAFGAFTSILSFNFTRVSGKGLSHAVGFPQVHFCATSSVMSSSGIDIRVRWIPVFTIGFTIDPLHVMRALSVTISGSILGPTFVR